MNRNKQKIHPNSLKESIFGYFSENVGLFRFVSVCYETVLFVLVFRTPKFLVFGFTKQTETNGKQILFRFVSVQTLIYFCLFRGHPSPRASMPYSANVTYRYDFAHNCSRINDNTLILICNVFVVYLFHFKTQVFSHSCSLL